MKKKEKKSISVAFLLILLLGITVGYSLLSTTLKINGTTGIHGNNWDVYWDSGSVSVSSGSITTTEPVVDEDGTSATYEVTLEMPGDFYEFTIDAVNNGSVDAMIGNVITTITDGDDQPVTLESYVKYSVTYADGVEIDKKHLLAKKDNGTATRQKYKVRIEYDRNSTTLPNTDLTYKINTEIKYQQADDTAIPKPAPTGN